MQFIIAGIISIYLDITFPAIFYLITIKEIGTEQIINLKKQPDIQHEGLVRRM